MNRSGASHVQRDSARLLQHTITSLHSVMKDKKLPIEDKRIYEIKIRLNTKEKERLDQVLTDCRTHAPDVFRRLLMKNSFPKAQSPLLDINTYYELRKIGVNMDQYVKAVHQGRLTAIDTAVINELSSMLKILRSKIISI